MPRPPPAGALALALIAIAAPAADGREDAPAELSAARIDATGTFLQPNHELPDGSPVYVHVTDADMPWRVSIGLPPVPPRDASRTRARLAAIEAMQMWERAIQPHVPWFRLEFVEKDRSAPVRFEWKRRIVGPWAGFGGNRVQTAGGLLRVGGVLEVSTQPDELLPAFTLDELRLLIAHEFGHVLGLGHCLDCDSAMNYSWQTRDRVLVTETDVRTFVALLAQPNLSAPGSAAAAR
jgi:predicted Zn-dependent protease